MDTWLNTRQQTLAQMQQSESWDMLVIGGGITGAGIAREVARQGKRVLLIEQRDFAWGTSSRSSKMVHGGLRYLASGNLKLTSHSVKERERLMNEAPGLVDLMTYSWPHYKGQFPGPKIFNLLLSVYDRFAGRRYRKFMKREQALLDLPGIREDGLLGSTRFADAVTDDSRLVMRVLREAAADGAHVINYCEASELIQNADGQVIGVKVTDVDGQQSFDVKASVVVSATGAWADRFRKQLGAQAQIRPLRGSHLVVPAWRLPVAQSITLKHPEDGRSMFIYPWEGMTVIGTTDLDNPEVSKTEPRIAQQEVTYLLHAANTLFPGAHLIEGDIVSTFAGVRPIVSSGALNPSAEKRDHSIWDDKGLVTVSGGKLTTFRLIALDVIKAAAKYLPDLDWRDHGQFIFDEQAAQQRDQSQLSALSNQMKRRLVGFYGRDIAALGDVAKTTGWSRIPGTHTYWAQLAHAAASEKVQHLDDLLLRRTRIGLFLPMGGLGFKLSIQQMCEPLLNWSEQQWQNEWTRYEQIWRDAYGLPIARAAVKQNNNNIEHTPASEMSVSTV